jgi:hypothetical protein
MIPSILVAIIGAIGAAHAAKVGREVKRVGKEVVPNGGSSLRDAVDRIERKQDGLTHRADVLGMRLEEHLTWAGDNESGVRS